jgi:uncharacterized protein (DUF927 family)
MCVNCGAQFDSPKLRPSHRGKGNSFEITDQDHYEEVRSALEEMHGQNQQFVRAGQIAELTDDINPQLVGRLLTDQGRAQGDVRPWRQDTRRTLWRITIDEPREVADD